MRALAIALAAIFATIAPAHALPAKLPPVEQCEDDRDFVPFRHSLTGAIRHKNLDALLPLLASDVLVDFGGGSGREAFAEKIDNAGDELWMALEQIVGLGCAQVGDARVIPSLAVEFDPSEEEEDLTYVMVALSGAKLRKTAEYDSPAIATLEWDVVRGIHTAGDFQTGVRLTDGREGWVADSDLYSPLGYRIYIERVEGEWMVTSLVAGD